MKVDPSRSLKTPSCPLRALRGGERPLLPLHSNFLGDLWPFRKRGNKPVAARGRNPGCPWGESLWSAQDLANFTTQKLKFNPPPPAKSAYYRSAGPKFPAASSGFPGPWRGGEAGGASKGHLGPLKNAWDLWRVLGSPRDSYGPRLVSRGSKHNLQFSPAYPHPTTPQLQPQIIYRPPLASPGQIFLPPPPSHGPRPTPCLPGRYQL